MKRLPLTLAIAAALALTAAATPVQGAAPEVTVRAAADADRIGDRDDLTLTIEIRGASLPPVAEPDLAGLADFSVANGPSTATSTSMVWDGGGAKVTTVKRYAWTLLPKRKGSLTIPSFAVVVGGTPFRTEEIKIEVESGSQKRAAPQPQAGPFNLGPFGPRPQRKAAAPAGDIFVEATVDRKEAFVGEEILLTYKLYTQSELAALPQPRQLPSYTGFWVEEIPIDPRATIKRTVVRGKEYLELTLMKKALFPTKSGDLPLDETAFEILVRADSGDPFDSFFNPARPIYRRTDPMTVKVKPLPEAGRPDSFRGAVGKFSLTAATDRKEAQVNDAVGLTVKVEGDGNVRPIGEPVLPDLPDYRRYDPKVEEKSDIQADRVKGSRTWTYVLVPLSAGEKAIPPVRFSYFDPAAGAYREISAPPIPIKIARGSGAAAGAEPGGVRRDVVAVGRDIRYIKPESAYEGGNGLGASAWLFGLLALPVVGNVAVYAHLRRRQRFAANVGLFRGRRASRVARSRLKRARALMSAGSEEAFFAEMDRAVTGYVADKFNLAAAGLTRQRMLDMLEHRGVPEDLRRRTIACLERCDFGRFAARQAARDQVTSLMAQGEEVLTSLERFLV
ncbi:MAG TPA: BatD family protein [Verrucomicrobiae bacterium]|nr:BatD family protein [Verrucomicrobiae bacterium]